MISIPLPEMLNKEIVINIKNQRFTKEQIYEINDILVERSKNRNKGFKIMLVISIMIVVMMIALSVSIINDGNRMALIFSSLLVIVILVLCMIVLKVFYVDGITRKFGRLIRKYYPDLEYDLFNQYH